MLVSSFDSAAARQRERSLGSAKLEIRNLKSAGIASVFEFRISSFPQGRSLGES